MNYPNEVIKKGSTNAEAVKAIKARLNSLGFSKPNKLDETNIVFGDSTEQRVKAFQKFYNLLVDGEVGELTWTRLFAGGVEKPLPITISPLAALAILFAKAQLNVRERTGKNDGEAVESYLRSVGLGKGYAWCAAFIYWCFREAARKLAIPTPLPQTGGVLEHLRKTKGKVLPPSQAQAGDIGIWDFGNGTGHMYLITEIRPSGYAFTIEGNTGADPATPEVDREGDGVYERNRQLSKLKAVIRY